MSKLFFLTFLAGWCLSARAQVYTLNNTHSHNDYEQPIPFEMAYNAGFASIEADIFLVDGKLLVGHDTVEIKAGRTLEDLYLRPLLTGLQQHNGHPYADTARTLQMLIDLKTDSVATLDALVAVLGKFPKLTGNRSIRWAITGNRPSPSAWGSYPPFIQFDGELDRDYAGPALARIVMMSDNFKHYSSWNGLGGIPATDRERLQEAVARSHRWHKPVRFWNAPDFSDAWKGLMGLQVDYINTDHIAALADFLRVNPSAP